MKNLAIILTGIFSLLFIAEASADGRRSRRWQNSSNNWVVPQQNYTNSSPEPYKGNLAECKDALDEVNAARAKRGLKPYINDPLLNKGALGCARFRAERLIDGHCPGQRGDFAFLPQEVNSNGVAGGCAAWTPDWGWGACCTYDNYTYCGAAWVMGRDGKRYMHLFVR